MRPVDTDMLFNDNDDRDIDMVSLQITETIAGKHLSEIVPYVLAQKYGMAWAVQTLIWLNNRRN